MKHNYTDQEILDMLRREDYYLVLKIRNNPDEHMKLKWNTMRTKWSILFNNKKL